VAEARQGLFLVSRDFLARGLEMGLAVVMQAAEVVVLIPKMARTGVAMAG